MKIKTFVFLLLYLCVDTFGYSQTFDPLDTILSKPLVIGIDTYSYLIKDDTYYEFSVERIITLKNAYVIQLQTTIDTISVDCFVVSPKGIDRKGMKIKKGQHYRMFLNRYNLFPVRASIESINTSDFLLGGRIASVNEDGLFKYMFYSPMLSGNRIRSMSDIERGNRFFAKDSLLIADFTQSFINLISKNFTQEQLYSVIDPKAMKKIMGDYSVDIQGRSPGEVLQRYKKKYPWRIDVSPPKYYSKRELRAESTYQLFCKLLNKQYRLPSEQETDDAAMILDLKLLYSCKDTLYTIRVIWENAGLKKRYVAVFDVEKNNDGFRIKHFNKPHHCYRLYVPKDNLRFVPLIRELQFIDF